MKKVVALLLLVVFTVSSLTMNVYASSFNIYIEGKALKIPSDMGSIFADSNGRVQVPVRALAETLKCKVDWDNETKTVIITRPDNMVVTLRIGSVKIHTGLGDLKMDTTPRIVNGRVHVPVRFAANALGYEVDYKKSGEVAKITLTKSDKKVVGDLYQPEPVYSIYSSILSSYFEGTNFSAACADLDLDGMDELIVIQTKGILDGVFAFVYKKDKLLGEIDLGNPNFMWVDICAGEDGKNYLVASTDSMHEGWSTDISTYYGIEKGVFKELYSITKITGPKNNDWSSGETETIIWVWVDGKPVNSKNAYYVPKYLSIISLCDIYYREYADNTDRGKDVHIKAAEEENKIKASENQSMNDSKLRAGLKELIGMSLYDSCDEGQLTPLYESEGANAYLCPGRDDVTLFVSFGTLYSVYIEYKDKVIPVFGLEIGKSKRSDVQKILGNGRDVIADYAYVGNPPGLASCTIYSYEKTELWIYYNSKDTVIAAFVKGLQE